MKKLILMVLCIVSISFANLTQTTIGCEDKSDLKKFIALSKTQEKLDLDEIYKFIIENDCEIIQKNDRVKLIGKPYSDGTSLIYIKKFDKDLYIITNKLKNKNTEINHRFNKSF